MLSRLTSTVFTVAVLMLTFPATALAEPPTEQELFDRLTDEQEREVILLIDEGEQALEAENFQRAADRFNEVHELFPHPSITYQLGRIYEQAGNFEMAIQYYGYFLEQEPDADERPQVEQAIAEMEDELGDDITGIRVETVPIGADIFIGDTASAPVGETPEMVTLEPGTYEIYVRKEGYHPDSTRVTIEEGTDDVIQFQLESTGRADDYQRRDLDRRGSNWWQPVVTVGLFGLGGFSAYQAVQFRSRADYIEQNLDDPNYDEHDRDNAANMSRTMGITAGVAFAGGLGFATWWLLSETGGPGGARLSISPSPSGLNVGLHGRF